MPVGHLNSTSCCLFLSKPTEAITKRTQIIMRVRTKYRRHILCLHPISGKVYADLYSAIVKPGSPNAIKSTIRSLALSF